jgi:CheY-like chemotaxis protein
MRVVIAEDNPIAQRLLAHTVAEVAGHDIVCVADGVAALATCEEAVPPDVLVLDWEMPGLTGPEVCSRVRALRLPIQPYLLLVTVRNSRKDVLAGLNAGADDLLSKPIARDLLVGRLRLASRRPGKGTRPAGALVQALLEAKNEGDGELLIRDRDISARVYFWRGKIGWAQVSNESGSLVDLISPVSQLDPETVRAVIEECQASGAPLTDVLVEWGVLDRAQLRACLRAWIQRKLDLLRGLSNPTTLFMPGTREGAEDLSFELDEFLEPAQLRAPRLSLPPPSATSQQVRSWSEAFVLSDLPQPELTALLEQCMSITGLRAAALVDPLTGICLGHAGMDLNPDIAWAMIQNLSVVDRQEPTESSLLSTVHHFHVAFGLQRAPRAILYAVFDRGLTSLASAWLELRSKAVSQLSAD